MPETINISIIEALNIAIKRIKSNFDSNWIITEEYDRNIQKLSDKVINATDHEQVFQKFEKVFIPDSHPFTEICTCISGSFAMQLGDRIFEVAEGNIVLISPNILHLELPKKNCDYIAIWLSVNNNKKILHLSGKNKTFFTAEGYTLKPDYEHLRLLNNIKIEIENKTSYYTETNKSYFLLLLISILREISGKSWEKFNNKIWKESIVLDVQKYIIDNYSKHIKLSDISQIMCISANYLNTMFKTITGKTIIQYIEDFKIEKAKELLVNTDSSINDISSQLGYYDQYHFSKIFKKATGISPTQFKKS